MGSPEFAHQEHSTNPAGSGDPNKPVEVTTANTKLQLHGGSARFELPLMSLDDYPQLPQLPEVTGKISPAALSGAVTQVAAAAGRDDTLPMLTGIHMEIQDNRLQLTATDRFRLALRRLSECGTPAAEISYFNCDGRGCAGFRIDSARFACRGPECPDPVAVSAW